MKRYISVAAIVAVFAAAVVNIVGGGSGHHATVKAAPGYTTPYGVQAHPTTFGLPPKGYAAQRPGLTAAPTFEMFDSVSVSAIPRSAQASAGYVSGFWVTFWHLFTRYRVSVATNAGAYAQCLDVEPGDAVPSQVVAWYHADVAHGYAKPCFYENASELPLVLAALNADHITRAHYFIWLALWVFHPQLVAGVDAQQWTDHGPQGQNYDESTVTPAFLGIKPSPQLPVCFTHRIAASACRTVKASVASDQRAAESSLRAFEARGCIELKGRERWFASKVAHDHTALGRKRLAYRRGALAATRRAEQRQQCSLFASRVGLFLSLSHQLQLAN